MTTENGNGHIETYGADAVVVIIAHLKEKARKQLSGFQITTRMMRKLLGQHFKRPSCTMWRLVSFVIHILMARGVLAAFSSAEASDTYSVNADLCHDLQPAELMATAP